MKKILFVGVFALATSGMFAQSSDFKKDVFEYLEITGGTSSQLKMMEAQFSQFIKEEDMKDLLNEIEKELPALNDQIADLYMKSYTHEEIKEILKFYKSPIGKKLSSKTVEIQPEMLEISQKWGISLQPILMKYLN